MKLMVINTPRGFVPYGDDDYEEKQKLKLGETYSVEIKVVRNLDFHRKYFALISYAWEFLTESETETFKTKENFRKYLEISAGHCEVIYHPRLQEFVEIPKSISFGKMDNTAFDELYKRVKDVIFSIIGERVSEAEFERLLLDWQDGLRYIETCKTIGWRRIWKSWGDGHLFS